MPIAYASLGVRWDHVAHYRIRFSDGHIEERHSHVSNHLPYWQFGHSDSFGQPPRHDETLKDPCYAEQDALSR